ncbi:hypothetical protein TNCV_3507911 [Trichonephila clavipes]|uniref:Uncharacterized protein n=1 Tax=Trichonephila clavipes TaxID=2585209 RepID=A0A8X6RZA7_TRICX|nr:hypothetical protein TNCV_3507911 [Trichonephila clavipes]
MVLKANDRRTSSPCHDEFRGPRSDCVRQLLSTLVKEKDIKLNVYHRHYGRPLDAGGYDGPTWLIASTSVHHFT